MKTGKTYKIVKIVLHVLLIGTTLIFPLFTALLTALSWSVNSHSYGYPFSIYAGVMATACLAIATGVVLHLFKKDIIAAVLGFVGAVAATWVGHDAIAVAEKSGWQSAIAANFGQTAAGKWAERIYPIWIPVGLLLLCAGLQFFSYEMQLRRDQKRKVREDKENMPAPSILGDDPD